MTSIAKMMTRAILLTTLAVAGVTSAATVSSAAPPVTKVDIIPGNGTTSTCNSWIICLYSDNNYQGFAVAGNGDFNAADLRLVSKGVLNDKISSIVNKSDSAYCFYSDVNRSGLTFLIHGHEIWPSLPVWMNDKISSWKVGNC